MLQSKSNLSSTTSNDYGQDWLASNGLSLQELVKF